MNVHQNARLTPRGRAEMVQRIEGGQRIGAVAAALGVGERTVRKWVARYRLDGLPGLRDRSSRPHRCPRTTAPYVVARIEALRRQRWTCAQIATAVGVAPATVARIVQRWGLSRLRALDPAPAVQRYEWATPGALLHVDSKKLGRIGRVGHRITGDRAVRTRGAGWEWAHVCVDDASRLAYVEMQPDERARTARGFLRRATAWFARAGVRVQRLMTDNGSAYRSHLYAAACRRLGCRQLFTRPYTPRTNGKAERFIQTLLREWAYARPYHHSRERRTLLPRWLHFYNFHRPHTSLQRRPPISRLAPGPDLLRLHT
jgi:transposase InsO family protein